MKEITGRLQIEGSPTEMFVSDKKAVIFSSVYDNSGAIGGKDKLASAANGYYCDVYYNCYSGTVFTKITVVDVDKSANPIVTRELYVEGNYLSARLYQPVDENKVKRNIVRVIITGGFKAPNFYQADIQYEDPWGKKFSQADIDEQVQAWRDRMVESVTATTLEDWLPRQREKVNNKLVSVDWLCGSSYLPAPGLTDYGMTNILAFDISDPKGTALGGAAVLGAAAQVYSNDKVLLLAHSDASWQIRATMPIGENVDGEQTALHQFDLQGIDAKYMASGFVPGHILNQFALDEYKGTVRVSTTREQWNNFVVMEDASADEAPFRTVPRSEIRQGPENYVVTLKAEDGELKQLGITKPLGKTGEKTYSTRFLGNLGYVVTFRQVDPLIVLDLSDPTNIKYLGEVTIPGFSDYIHPLDDTHLLTIGRNTDENGFDIGLLLQIFDVSEPAKPRQSFTYKYEKQGWSEANQNHKAFTYFAEKKLLAFPFASYSYPFSSTLKVFRIDADNAPGFTYLGAIDHTDLFLQDSSCNAYITTNGYFDPYYCQRPAPEVRRGVFMSEELQGAASVFVYSISYAGIKVNDIKDLTTPLATVLLPPIQYTGVDYGGGATGTGGAAGGIVNPGDLGGAGGTAVTGGSGGTPEVDGGTAGAGGV